MRLYLLRHAPAVSREAWGKKADRLRPLTLQGARQMTAMVRQMRAWKIRPQLILSSPFERCRKSAQIAAAGLKSKAPRFLPGLQPGASPKALLRVLAGKYAARQSLMLVGHEPGLSRLLRLLLGVPKNSLRVDFEKGGFCGLETDLARKRPKAVLISWVPPSLVLPAR